MKIQLTKQQGLRLDLEDVGDWQVMEALIDDIQSATRPLAERMGELVSDEALAADWRELVVPELNARFDHQLECVMEALEKAASTGDAEPASILIDRSAALEWYGALNQARLALEERYHFGTAEAIDPQNHPAAMCDAFLRSRFYLSVQSVLLHHVMT